MGLTSTLTHFPLCLTCLSRSPQAQPHEDIEELHIFTPSVGIIDFHALIEVAEHLPHLQSLLLSLQTENMPELDSVPFLSHHLVSLDVWISPVVKPAHLNIAIGLFKLFPTIRYLQHDTRGRYSSLWRRVGTIIPFLKEAAHNQNTTSGRDGEQPTSDAHFHSGLRVHEFLRPLAATSLNLSSSTYLYLQLRAEGRRAVQS
ncbi:hypothetical protein BDZ97DRAFT_1301744 [Flammula alnicola]|nr:hypothetical protein BDZ97DRAFT_1301744 [Flammula alnicola]